MAPAVPEIGRTSKSSLLSQIGNTPLMRLAKLDAEFPGVEIYAKAEFFNPGGSVKDRAGLNMILDGERTGRLTPRPDPARRHQRQHRHRLRHDRRDQGLQGEAVPARQRLA